MPSEMISKIIRKRPVNHALNTLRLLHNALFDIKVHSPKSHEDIVNMNISELYNRLLFELTGLNGPQDQGHEWGHGEGSMVALTKGYDVGMYSYLV